MIRCLAALGLLTIAAGAPCGDRQGRPREDVQTVVAQGRGTPEGRAAWARLSAGGPELLPLLLGAMDTPSTATANWLRTAFDSVLDRALQGGGKGIDADR